MLHIEEETTCPLTLSGEDIHLEGRCEDCDVRRLVYFTLGMAEDCYRTGRIGQDLYEAYCHVFAALSPTGALPEYRDESPFPRVRRVVRKLMRAKGYTVPGTWRGPCIVMVKPVDAVEIVPETGGCADSGPMV